MFRALESWVGGRTERVVVPNASPALANAAHAVGGRSPRATQIAIEVMRLLAEMRQLGEEQGGRSVRRRRRRADPG